MDTRDNTKHICSVDGDIAGDVVTSFSLTTNQIENVRTLSSGSDLPGLLFFVGDEQSFCCPVGYCLA